jgi:hypothetical protein
VAGFDFTRRRSAIILHWLRPQQSQMTAVTKSILLAIVAAAVCITGCGGANDTPVPPKPRLTTSNFDAIQNGMSKVQVIQILGRWTEEVPEPAGPAGKPAAAASSLLHYRWKKESSQIDITFDGDKVASKSSTGLAGTQ